MPPWNLQFKFDFDKAMSVMAYLLRQGGATDKVKLMKLVYLADRESYIRYGVPITGDRLVAMRYGPVPSACLDILNASPR